MILYYIILCHIVLYIYIYIYIQLVIALHYIISYPSCRRKPRPSPGPSSSCRLGNIIGSSSGTIDSGISIISLISIISSTIWWLLMLLLLLSPGNLLFGCRLMGSALMGSLQEYYVYYLQESLYNVVVLLLLKLIIVLVLVLVLVCVLVFLVLLVVVPYTGCWRCCYYWYYCGYGFLCLYIYLILGYFLCFLSGYLYFLMLCLMFISDLLFVCSSVLIYFWYFLYWRRCSSFRRCCRPSVERTIVLCI